MNEFVSITAGLYFEITDGECFGGIGTIGYTAMIFNGVHDVSLMTDEYIGKQIQEVAEIHKVSKEKVKLITKEEYDNNVDEEDC